MSENEDLEFPLNQLEKDHEGKYYITDGKIKVKIKGKMPFLWRCYLVWA